MPVVNGFYRDNASLPCCPGATVVPVNKLATPVLTFPTVGQTDFTVDWQDIANANLYDADIATDAGFGNIVDSPRGLTTSQYTTSGRLAGTNYYARVIAHDSTGAYIDSDYGTGSVQTAMGIAAPTLSAQRSANSVRSTFNNPTGGTDIVLQRSTGNTFANNVPTTIGFGQMSYDSTGLPLGVTYFYRAKTIDANTGTESAWSATVQVTTFNTILAVSGTSSGAQASVAGQAGFEVHFDDSLTSISPPTPINDFTIGGQLADSITFDLSYLSTTPKPFAVKKGGVYYYNNAGGQQLTFQPDGTNILIS